MKILALVMLCSSVLAIAQSPTPTDSNKLVQLDQIDIRGTRLPTESVIRISGLKIGEMINDLIVNKACQKITATGLVKNIDYAYDLYPNKPGVALTLTLADEGPLLPARIKPEKDAALFEALQTRDPIFTREMPRTDNALRFYETNLESCLKSQGRENEYAAPSVIGDANGNASEIVFEIRAYKQIPQHKH